MTHTTAELTQWTVQQRRHFHKHPELSGQEHKTAAYVKERLEEFGIPLLDGFTAPNVVAFFKGTEGSRTVALRADMDALPVHEQVEKPFSSTVPGVMHACGHDAHTATLLGAAKWMSEHPELVKNNIVLIFQSSEEESPSGAQQLVKDGVLEGVDAIYGLHYMSNVALGKVGFAEGFSMASSDDFDIVIEGNGGHGGIPQDTVDPIYVATHVIQSFQSIISRNLNPFHPGVISFGRMEAGNSYNVIPDQVTLKGTIRALSFEGQELMYKRTVELAEKISDSFGAVGHYHYIEGTPPVYNHPEACATARGIIQSTFGDDVFTEVEPTMGAEDFGYYLKGKTGAFINVGMKGEKSAYPHHHPKFDVDEDTIPTGLELMIQLALKG
ncbi:amidohydrolase [Halobacillus halophilus]|uniref:M20 metallopeptidase family protein n=1 Tax=Halobacillus halophilus TaxID=1570 RepID=UPI00136EF26F|nr:amidohydrolase [Halobacillus halophilus]MYL29678.1 amidohydrolase [Halobacillus halophilus]